MNERRRSETAGGGAAENAASRPKAESGWGVPPFQTKLLILFTEFLIL